MLVVDYGVRKEGTTRGGRQEADSDGSQEAVTFTQEWYDWEN